MANSKDFNDVLDDIAARFLINLPDESKNDIYQLFFDIENAHWFYLDEYYEENKSLPEIRRLEKFIEHIFERYPSLFKLPKNLNLTAVFNNWIKYKRAVPTYGAIILDDHMKNVLLVQGYHSKVWGFPKGKVLEKEDPVTCAIREVKEETGFNIKKHLDPERKYSEVIKDDQLTRLYFVTDVPMSTKFTPECKCEIGDLQWVPIQDLKDTKHKQQKVTTCKIVSNLFMVRPHVRDLKNYAKEIIRKRRQKLKNLQQGMLNSTNQLAPLQPAVCLPNTMPLHPFTFISPHPPVLFPQPVAVPNAAPLLFQPPRARVSVMVSQRVAPSPVALINQIHTLPNNHVGPIPALRSISASPVLPHSHLSQPPTNKVDQVKKKPATNVQHMLQAAKKKFDSEQQLSKSKVDQTEKVQKSSGDKVFDELLRQFNRDCDLGDLPLLNKGPKRAELPPAWQDFHFDVDKIFKGVFS